jgi:hypothetical protein
MTLIFSAIAAKSPRRRFSSDSRIAKDRSPSQITRSTTGKRARPAHRPGGWTQIPRFGRGRPQSGPFKTSHCHIPARDTPHRHQGSGAARRDPTRRRMGTNTITRTASWIPAQQSNSHGASGGTRVGDGKAAGWVLVATHDMTRRENSTNERNRATFRRLPVSSSKHGGNKTRLPWHSGLVVPFTSLPHRAGMMALV